MKTNPQLQYILDLLAYLMLLAPYFPIKIFRTWATISEPLVFSS